MQNLSKWVHLSFLAGAVLAAVLLRELFTLAFDPLGFNRLDWIVSPADLAGIFCGAALFIFLLRFEKATTFLTEVFSELAKVTWPNTKETGLSTGVVAIMVGIATFCIMLFDSLWSWVSERLLY